MQHYDVFETALGFVGMAWNEVGITSLLLPTRDPDSARRLLLRRAGAADFASPVPERITSVIASVKRYFDGEQVDFSSVPLDLGERGEFFQQVYAALRQVGWGRTTTYGGLSQAIGAGPETARGVGQAMAKNPVPLIIPCHRVLAAGGKLGGFSAPGGGATKVRMLELEGVRVESVRSDQQGSFDF
jgi:methylated-DNA-[protein]-cysteine S-methyltransferase